MVKTKLLVRCFLGMANVMLYNHLPLRCYFQLQKPFCFKQLKAAAWKDSLLREILTDVTGLGTVP